MLSDIKFDDDINFNKNDVPYDLISCNCNIELFDNKKFNYEGKYKIIEYTSELLVIRKKNGRIIINGSNLSINNVRKTSFSLIGKIESIVFE